MLPYLHDTLYEVATKLVFTFRIFIMSYPILIVENFQYIT